MNIKLSIFASSAVLALVAMFSVSASAQGGASPVVRGNNLYCAGFIQTSAISTGNTIIGARGEADQFNFSQGDFVYMNVGRDKGVNVGDTFSVIRPRATVKSKWTRKSELGFYVQELGAVEVVAVKSDYSVAKIKMACDSFLLGDVVQLSERRTSPVVDLSEPIDIFADASGRATGRILMGRDNAEMMTRDFVAYVDLGADDNVRVGDTLRIYRDLDKGNILKNDDRESVSARDYGYRSETYKGGNFSNQAKRKKGDKADGREVRTRDVRNDRRPGLRKVVGEAVIINVKERTATIVITKTAQEIHTGDWVELK